MLSKLFFSIKSLPLTIAWTSSTTKLLKQQFKIQNFTNVILNFLPWTLIQIVFCLILTNPSFILPYNDNTYMSTLSYSDNTSMALTLPPLHFGLCPRNLVNNKVIFVGVENNYKFIWYVVNELFVLLEQHICD